MKKLIKLALCTFPLVITPAAFAQTGAAGQGAANSATTPSPRNTPSTSSDSSARNQGATPSASSNSSATGQSGSSAASGDSSARMQGANPSSSTDSSPSSSGAMTPPAGAPSQTNPGSPAAPGSMLAPSTTDRSAADGAPKTMVSGISVKDKLMGKTVYNENDEKIGSIVDVVLDTGGAMSTLVVGAGGFLGMGEHNVAIPYDKVTRGAEDKLVLAGYTKDQLKSLPEVKVTR